MSQSNPKTKDELREHLKDIIRNIPRQPGIYKYKDESNEIIYVGKAKELRKRVSSYFTKSHQYDRKTRQLVREIRNIEITIVDSEADALLLENNLIKAHQPKYNILLKDGKSYPYICITDEPFPRVFTTRTPNKRQGTNYGPYTNGKTLYALNELIKKLYTLRTCSYNLSEENIREKKYRVCLEYHIKNCKGPCEGLQEEEDYLKDIEQIRNILAGKTSRAKEYFKTKMKSAAEKMEFEEAQKAKEKWEALHTYQSKSLITNPNISDTEVIALLDDEATVYVNYLKIEDGSIVYTANESYKKRLEETLEDILPMVAVEFRQRFGSEAQRIVSNILAEVPLPKVEVINPKIGDLRKLLDLSLKNVGYFKKERLRKKLDFAEKKQERGLAAVEALQKDLGLKELPLHVECFDNSNLQGTNPVSSMVCFMNGKPSKRNYRKYHVKTVEGANDFATMYEVVYRRYRRLLEEKQPLPNLVIVDGGKGQLSFGAQALKDLGVYGKIPIVGIAKRLEEVFYPEDQHPIYINKKSPSLKLIQHLRNEAHRFAITFHRDIRSKNALRNPLENVKGVGRATIEKLLLEYKSIKKIAVTSDEELKELIGANRTRLIKEYIKNNPDLLS
ncbi:excinuclease ABC subunit UvrC [Bernardetia sp. MNP-M8]|uniref:excinuclease ABC subunit UvrC n=1 Tax=Bernardetia sp. MNP-M8 TaxID=3127470 RepID=UPI0030CBE89E